MYAPSCKFSLEEYRNKQYINEPAGKQVQQIVQKNGIALCYHAIPRMGN